MSDYVFFVAFVSSKSRNPFYENKEIMKIAQNWTDYSIIATGDGYKLERWKNVYLLRPDPQVIWSAQTDLFSYPKLNAYYKRSENGGGGWKFLKPMPAEWDISYEKLGLNFKIKPMGFKHTGLFPEQSVNWEYMSELIRGAGRPVKVLNLFAYTGGASLAARAAGAETTHVDSVKQVVTWSRENMELSGLDGIRWIVEDALKFVRREVRRGSRYNGIILDPPAYGRGANGEKWILEENICEMLACCAQLLEPQGAFLVLNLYSMGLSSTLARTAVRQAFGAPLEEQYGELCFTDRAGKQLPLGTYYRFIR